MNQKPTYEELEESHAQVIQARDFYKRANGVAMKRIAELEAHVAELEANQITATGTQFLSEAIGAHAYIAGCLVQGRPDLALEEAHKWVSVFSEVAAGINLETGGE